MIYLDNNTEPQKVAINITAGGSQYYSIVPENPNVYYTQSQVDGKFTKYYERTETYNTEEIETELFTLRKNIEQDTAETYETKEDAKIRMVEVRVNTLMDIEEAKMDLEVQLDDRYTKDEVFSKDEVLELVQSGDVPVASPLIVTVNEDDTLNVESCKKLHSEFYNGRVCKVLFADGTISDILFVKKEKVLFNMKYEFGVMRYTGEFYTWVIQTIELYDTILQQEIIVKSIN